MTALVLLSLSLFALIAWASTPAPPGAYRRTRRHRRSVHHDFTGTPEIRRSDSEPFRRV